MKLFQLSFWLVVLLCWSHGYSQDVQLNNSSLPALKFIPNQGQVANNFSPKSDVLFHIEGQAVYLREDGITFQLNNYAEVKHEVHEKVEAIEHSEEGLGNLSEPEWEAAFLSKEKLEVQQVSLTFLNTNKHFEIEKSEPSNDYLNYYLAQCPNGVLDVHLHNFVNYTNIYDGIDINFYGNESGELEYDFRISPYANPQQIKLKWTGANDVSVSEDGELRIGTKVQNFQESLPLVYQLIGNDTVHIMAGYKLESKKNGSFLVSYELGKYDETYALIIDPWVTNYGGEWWDSGNGLTTDEDGNVLLTGTTGSTIGIAEDGFSEVHAGMGDAYLVKFDELGNRLWGTYYGGDSLDTGDGVAADANNNVFLCGSTRSHVGIADSGFQNEFGGALYDFLFTYGDLYLVKFNSAGTRIWSTYYGGEGGEYTADTFVGDDGSVYLSGNTGSLDGIASFDGFQTTHGGGFIMADGFLVKFTNDGDRAWATYSGGNNQDKVLGVTTDRENNVYLAGNTSSTIGISTPLAFQELWSGSADAYLVKFNSSGDRLWGTYFGAYAEEQGSGVDCDSLNNVYLAGYTQSSTGIAFDGYQMEHGNTLGEQKRDAFLAKFDSEGNRIWATYFGGELNDYALSVDVDKETNNIAITGDTYSFDFPVSACAIQSELIGSENAFITQFQPSGDLYCSTYFGADHEENNKLTFGSCYLYITGTSPVSVSTPGSHQEIYGGSAGDAYLAQVYKNSCGIEESIMTVTSSYTDVTDCNTCDGEISVQVSTEGCTGALSYITYIWSTGAEYINSVDTSNTLTDVCAGSYWVYVELNCGLGDTLFFDLGSEYNLAQAEFESEDVCLGESTTFVNLSTTDVGGIISHEWNFGDSETSTDENPNHIFETEGTYIVVLTVENSSGCTDTVYHEVNVFPTYSLDETTWVCPDSLFTFPDGVQETVLSNTIHTSSMSTVAGCDSIITTSVNLFPIYQMEEMHTVCSGASFTYPDGVQETITEITAHTSSLSTLNGCDSIITTIINLSTSIISYDTIIVKVGELIYFPNGDSLIIEENEVHTSFLIGADGCDSTIVNTYLINDFSFIPPNIFSPDAHNANNTFFFPQKYVQNFECTIVNRWGVAVFEFNSILDEWNGTNQKTNEPCTDGTYFYTYQGTTVFNTSFSGQGTVQLVRK